MVVVVAKVVAVVATVVATATKVGTSFLETGLLAGFFLPSTVMYDVRTKVGSSFTTARGLLQGEMPDFIWLQRFSVFRKEHL